MKKIFGLLLVLILVFSITSCSKEEKKETNKEMDLSENSDKSLMAYLEGDSFNYTLRLTGSGKAVDYSSKEAVPWNYLASRIKKVVIDDNVTSLGDYFFTMLSLKEYEIPKNVTRIGKNCFKDDVKLYSYSTNFTYNGSCKIYYYSETKPNEEDKYFHVIDGEYVIWSEKRILFIGNSFTYRPGSEDNPMIPKLYQDLADNLGESVSVDYVVKGSHTLAGFADKNSELGSKIVDYLNNNQYNFVILQEQSTRPLNYFQSFSDSVGILNDLVKATQKECKVCLYETWGSPTAISTSSYKTIGEMEMALREAYEKVGKAYNLDVHYIGKAFTVVDENYKDLYLYDETDHRHQNLLGAYLSACMHLMYTLKLDVRKATDNGGLSKTDAATLREIAYNVVKGIESTGSNENVEVKDSIAVAFYTKTATSGVNQAIIDNVKTELTKYLKSQNISEDVINKIVYRGYDGNVQPSCEAIKKDGDVIIMVGWKSNVDTTGGLEYVKAYPGDPELSGITIGSVENRWIHMLKEDSLSTLIYDYFISENGQKIFLG